MYSSFRVSSPDLLCSIMWIQYWKGRFTCASSVTWITCKSTFPILYSHDWAKCKSQSGLETLNPLYEYLVLVWCTAGGAHSPREGVLFMTHICAATIVWTCVLGAHIADLNCLEMFARNLVPGWTSWGDEVLKFQQVSWLPVSCIHTKLCTKPSCLKAGVHRTALAPLLPQEIAAADMEGVSEGKKRKLVHKMTLHSVLRTTSYTAWH